MNPKQIKRLMTDVAKGKLTMKDAEKKMEPKKIKLNKTGGKKSQIII